MGWLGSQVGWLDELEIRINSVQLVAGSAGYKAISASAGAGAVAELGNITDIEFSGRWWVVVVVCKVIFTSNPTLCYVR